MDSSPQAVTCADTPCAMSHWKADISLADRHRTVPVRLTSATTCWLMHRGGPADAAQLGQPDLPCAGSCPHGCYLPGRPTRGGQQGRAVPCQAARYSSSEFVRNGSGSAHMSSHVWMCCGWLKGACAAFVPASANPPDQDSQQLGVQGNAKHAC